MKNMIALGNRFNRTRLTVHAAMAVALLAGAWGPAGAAGGFYGASGHGSATTGVNRQPALYARGECGHCHEAHASQDADATLYPYTLFAREENVCWGCHTGTVTYAADARSAFSTTPVNTATDFYKHPVSSLYNGLTPSAHRAGESLPAVFSGANRHAECADCHDAHAADNTGTAGNSTHIAGGPTGNLLSGALLGPTGIVVGAWQGAGQPFSAASKSLQRLTSLTANYEWQLCFKCHSTFTALPTYSALGSGNFAIVKLTSTNVKQVKEYQDVGQAFNPTNLALHPVTATGRNTAIPAGSFVSPWATTSRMYCSDCHNKQLGASGASGPHGSTNMHLLERPAYLTENRLFTDTSWGTTIGVGPNDLCLKCHRYQTYVQRSGTAGADPTTNTNFRNHSRHIGEWGRGCTCYTCHDPHGANKEHLLNFNMAIVTTSTANSQAAFTHAARGGTCNVTCHGESHSESYSY